MPDHRTDQVAWIMRKPRSLGNFSIETSYRTMRDHWPESASTPHVHTVSRFTSGIANRLAIWREVRALPHRLIHITGDIHFTAIGLRSKPVVLTIHDLGLLDEGNAFQRFVKRLFWLNLPLRACDRVIAVSDKTRQDIHSRSGYPVDRIAVIPSVISPTFRPRQTEPDLPTPRILHIGLADNKNLDRHAAAIRGLDVHLRIIGEPSDAQHAMLKDNGIDYSCASKLSEEELQTEYANASLLLFCSTLEGYGMPIIEAQTIGVPVITSDRSPMRETAGGGALLANPDNVEAIRGAVQSLLSGEADRSALIDAGHANAKACSAARSAELHAGLYRSLLALD